MDGRQISDDSESRFAAFVDGIVSVIGHADRAGPLRDYCIGLMMPSERKSVEPMAALTAPERTAAQHQSLLHFVGQAAWSDERVLAKVREMVLPRFERHEPIERPLPERMRHLDRVIAQLRGLAYELVHVLDDGNTKLRIRVTTQAAAASTAKPTEKPAAAQAIE